MKEKKKTFMKQYCTMCGALSNLITFQYKDVSYDVLN